jgi:hypothetical protein
MSRTTALVVSRASELEVIHDYRHQDDRDPRGLAHVRDNRSSAIWKLLLRVRYEAAHPLFGEAPDPVADCRSPSPYRCC